MEKSSIVVTSKSSAASATKKILFFITIFLNEVTFKLQLFEFIRNFTVVLCAINNSRIKKKNNPLPKYGGKKYDLLVHDCPIFFFFVARPKNVFYISMLNIIYCPYWKRIEFFSRRLVLLKMKDFHQIHFLFNKGQQKQKNKKKTEKIYWLFFILQIFKHTFQDKALISIFPHFCLFSIYFKGL